MAITPLLLDDQLCDVALLSVPQVAELWGCSRTTVYDLIKIGALRVVYPASDMRVPATELKRWIDRHLAHPPLAARPRQLRRLTAPE